MPLMTSKFKEVVFLHTSAVLRSILLICYSTKTAVDIRKSFDRMHIQTSAKNNVLVAHDM